jgi:hypothetical protein
LHLYTEKQEAQEAQEAQSSIKIAGDGFEPPHLIHETNKLTITLSHVIKIF